MDIIQIEYKGKKLIAKEKSGAFIVRLSDQKAADGIVRNRMARITDEYIQMLSIEAECKSKFSIVYLYNDGTIKHEDYISRFFDKPIQVAERKFELTADNSEFPYNVAQELAGIKVEMDKVLVWKNKIYDLKRRMFNIKLRRLGYVSQEAGLSLLTDYATTCDLNAVVSDIEMYSRLDKVKTTHKLEMIPGFSKRVGEDMIYVEPTADIELKLSRLIEALARICEQEEFVIDNDEDITERKRRLLQESDDKYSKDFAIGIPGILSRTDREWSEYAEYIYIQGKKFLSRDNSHTDEELEEPKRSILANNILWRIYAEQIRNLAGLYMGINHELLNSQVADSVEDLTKLTSDDYNKRVSEILEADKLGRAIDIENIFVIAINLDFIPLAEAELASLAPDIQRTGVGDSIRELIEDAKSKIASRIESIERRRELAKKSSVLKKPDHDDNPGGGPGGNNR